MLEVARVLVADPSIRLVAPVVFLFDGGEETFSQAAHGFMQKYDKPLGVFMNLESTGPGGPDYVFQQTGERSLGNRCAVPSFIQSYVAMTTGVSWRVQHLSPSCNQLS